MRTFGSSCWVWRVIWRTRRRRVPTHPPPTKRTASPSSRSTTRRSELPGLLGRRLALRLRLGLSRRFGFPFGRLGCRPALPGVRGVEAGTLEDDSDGMNNAVHGRAAFRAGLHRLLPHAVTGFEPVPVGVALILVKGHQ